MHDYHTHTHKFCIQGHLLSLVVDPPMLPSSSDLTDGGPSVPDESRNKSSFQRGVINRL